MISIKYYKAIIHLYFCLFQLAFYLVVKFNDMTSKPEDENGQFLRTPNGLGATVKRPGYSQRYAKELIKRTGSRYASQE